jgi:type IV pilus assembly protein PilC
LIYPLAVTIICLVITVFLIVVVVPIFREIYAQFGTQLPRPTQWLIEASHTLRGHFVYLALAIGGLGYGWWAYLQSQAGREFWDRWRIRLPMLGPIAHKIALARFARTFASLFRSGVPILEVLQMVAGTSGNVIMEQAARQAAKDIEKGDGIASALSKHPIFPSMVLRMLSAGEQTGRVDTMLERVADFLDEEIDTTLTGLMSLIEPLLIVFLGVLIGGIVVCMFLPILSLNELITQR